MDTHSAYSGASQTATVTSALRSAPDPERCTDLPAWVTVYTLSAAFLVGMEWLFFRTRPSFLDALTPLNQVLVFGATLLPVIAVGAFALVVFAAVGRTSVPLVRTASHVGMRSLPTILLGSSSLLLVDTSPRPYLAGASQPRRFIGSHTWPRCWWREQRAGCRPVDGRHT